MYYTSHFCQHLFAFLFVIEMDYGYLPGEHESITANYQCLKSAENVVSMYELVFIKEKYLYQ